MWSQTRVQTGSESEYGSEVPRECHKSWWCQPKLGSCTDTESEPGPEPPSTAVREASSCSGQWRVMLVNVLGRGWMLNSLCDVPVNSPRPTPSPTLLCLKKYHARGGWRNVRARQWRSEFSEMLPSGHVKAIAVMSSHQLCLPAQRPYEAKPTKLSPRWGRRCLSHTPYWGAISSW